jgi:hypothetical protein
MAEENTDTGRVEIPVAASTVEALDAAAASAAHSAEAASAAAVVAGAAAEHHAREAAEVAQQHVESALAQVGEATQGEQDQWARISSLESQHQEMREALETTGRSASELNRKLDELLASASRPPAPEADPVEVAETEVPEDLIAEPTPRERDAGARRRFRRL